MLNERIRKLRLAKGMTLQQVGDVFGISRGSVSSWESGVNIPDARKLAKLAEVLGTTVESLLTGSNVESSSENFVSRVKFYEWDEITKQMPDAIEMTTALHRSLGPNAFATRFPGSKHLHCSYPPVPPGALIFIDPDKTPVISNVVLFKSTTGKLCISVVHAPNGSNDSLSIENESKKIFKITSKEVFIFGVVTEWRISSALY